MSDYLGPGKGLNGEVNGRFFRAVKLLCCNGDYKTVSIYQKLQNFTAQKSKTLMYAILKAFRISGDLLRWNVKCDKRLQLHFNCISLPGEGGA